MTGSFTQSFRDIKVIHTCSRNRNRTEPQIFWLRFYIIWNCNLTVRYGSGSKLNFFTFPLKNKEPIFRFGSFLRFQQPETVETETNTSTCEVHDIVVNKTDVSNKITRGPQALMFQSSCPIN